MLLLVIPPAPHLILLLAGLQDLGRGATAHGSASAPATSARSHALLPHSAPPLDPSTVLRAFSSVSVHKDKHSED